MTDSEPPVPPAAAPPRPRRLLRRLLIVAAAFVLLLGVTVALLPAMLSSNWARARVEAAVAEGTGRTFALGGLSVGWARTVLTGVRLGADAGAAGGDLATIARVEVEPDLRAALGGVYRVPRLVVTGPVLRVDLRERPADAAKGASPGASSPGRGGSGAGAAEPLPDFSVHAEIREGRLVVVLPDGTEAAPVGFAATVDASRDGPATVDLALDLPAGGRVALRAAATPFAAGRPVDPADLDAEVKVEVTDAVLEGLLPLLRPFVDLRELSGRLTLRTTLRSAGGARMAQAVTLEIRDLVAAGPALGEGCRVQEPALTLTAATLQASAEGALEGQEVVLLAKGLDVRGSVLRAADGAVTGSLSGKGSLAPFGDRARAWGLPSEGSAAGDATFDVRFMASAGAQRATGALEVRDLQVSPGPGRAPVLEPRVSVTYDVRRDGGATRVDGTSIECGFLSLRCGGEIREGGDIDLQVEGKARLVPLLAVARAFGAAPAGEIAGEAHLDAHVRRKGDEGEARGTLTLLEFGVLPPGEGAKPFRQERVDVTFDAAPGKDRIAIRALEVRGGFARVVASGSAAADGGSGSVETSVEVDCAPALAVLRTLGVPVPVELAGTAGWKGPISWSDGGSTLRLKGRASLRDALLTLPAEAAGTDRTLRESLVELDLDGALVDGGATVTAAALRMPGLEATASGTVAKGGALDVRASGGLDLAVATARATELGLVERDPRTRGRLVFDASATGTVERARVELRRLAAEGAPFALDVAGSFDPDGPVAATVKAGGDAAEVLDLLARAGLMTPVTGAAGAISVDATASAADGKAPVRFRAAVRGSGLRYVPAEKEPPWTQDALDLATEGAWDRTAETVVAEVSLRADAGTASASGSATLREGARTLDARGALDLDAARLLASHPSLRSDGVKPGRVAGTFAVRGPLRAPFDLEPLAGETNLRVDRVETEHLVFTECAVEAILQGGAVATRSLAAKANGGEVTGRVVAALAGTTRRHVAEVDASGVRLDRALAALLAKIVPIFSLDRAGEASGLVDLRCRLESEGAEGREIERALRGEGTLTVRDGAVRGSGIVAAVLDVLRMGKEIRFSTVATEFKIHDERVWNERITVDGADQSMVLRGSTSFSGEIDYRVGARFLGLGKKRQEQIAPLLDKEGNLPFTVGGTLTSPKIKAPDLKEVAGNVIDGLLKKGLEDLLGGKKDEGK